nr:MAG TPA: hypothetical protein [Caudoviricetes sp.]
MYQRGIIRLKDLIAKRARLPTVRRHRQESCTARSKPLTAPGTASHLQRKLFSVLNKSGANVLIDKRIGGLHRHGRHQRTVQAQSRTYAKRNCKPLTFPLIHGIMMVHLYLCEKEVSEMAFDANKYKNQYEKDNYDRILILVPKGKKADIKERAEELGISVSELIVRALEKMYLLDLSK